MSVKISDFLQANLWPKLGPFSNKKRISVLFAWFRIGQGYMYVVYIGLTVGFITMECVVLFKSSKLLLFILNLDSLGVRAPEHD